MGDYRTLASTGAVIMAVMATAVITAPNANALTNGQLAAISDAAARVVNADAVAQIARRSHLEGLQASANSAKAEAARLSKIVAADRKGLAICPVAHRPTWSARLAKDLASYNRVNAAYQARVNAAHSYQLVYNAGEAKFAADQHNAYVTANAVTAYPNCPPSNLYAGATSHAVASYPGVSITAYNKPGRTPVYVTAVNLQGPGARGLVGPISQPLVPQRTKPADQIRNSGGAVAAVNGDFYYIGSDMSPWGAQVNRGGHVVKSSTYAAGYNHFMINSSNGLGSFGPIKIVTTLTHGPARVAANQINSHGLLPNNIAVFTSAWGSAGRGVSGSMAGVREFYVNTSGYITKINTHATRDSINGGRLIMAQGAGVNRLSAAGFRIGAQVGLTSSAPGVYSAIGVGQGLLRNGRFIQLSCPPGDPVAHTILGLTPGNRRLLIVTVEGQTDSATSHFSGLSIRDEAGLMKGLGAYQAYNLDGGGSTILTDKVAGGYRMVTHSPGWIRPVANSFAAWAGR